MNSSMTEEESLTDDVSGKLKGSSTDENEVACCNDDKRKLGSGLVALDTTLLDLSRIGVHFKFKV